MIVIVHPSPSKLLLMLSRMVKLFLMLLRAKVLDYYSKLSHAFHIILHQMGQRKRIGFFPLSFSGIGIVSNCILNLTQIQYAFEYNLTLSLEGDTKAAILCEINDSFVHTLKVMTFLSVLSFLVNEVSIWQVTQPCSCHINCLDHVRFQLPS